MGIIQRIKSAFTLEPQQKQSLIQNRNKNALSVVSGLSIPVSTAAKVATKSGSVIKSAYGGAKNFLVKNTQNPFNTGIKSFGKALLGKTLIGGLIGGAHNVAYSGITGEPITSKGITKSMQVGAAFGINPIGATTGIASGLFKKGADTTKDLINSINKPTTQSGYYGSQEWVNQMKGMYNYPTIPGFEIPTPNFNIQMPNFSLPNATLPQNVASPSYTAPSVNVNTPSTGFGDILPLLLLGGAGILGGYALGRRKRKKRKYKKRKR